MHPSADIATVPLDLGDLASTRDCAKRLIDSGKPIDVLLNNAGEQPPASSPHQWNTMWAPPWQPASVSHQQNMQQQPAAGAPVCF